jgi:hypothetical protein
VVFTQVIKQQIIVAAEEMAILKYKNFSVEMALLSSLKFACKSSYTHKLQIAQ